MFDPEDLTLLFPEEGEELWGRSARTASRMRGSVYKGEYVGIGYHPKGCYVGHPVEESRCILDADHGGCHANTYLVWWPVPGEVRRI